ncbi:hypothetical protein F4859DRAFT_498658 [Xylaria cf. heliscus]|nr:hypothetical protein F4859DRAFT_498658 [Xylaria cf. heliscus]
MADTQVFTRSPSFVNTTTTIPTSSTAPSTSDPSSSSSVTFLPTTTISTIFPPSTSYPSAVSSAALCSAVSSTSDLSIISSLGIPIPAFSDTSTILPLTESVLGPPFIPIPISLSSLPASSVTLSTIPSTSTSLPTKLSSSLGPATASTTTYPTPVDVSSQISSPTQSNPNITTSSPTSPSAPPSVGDQRNPPVLMIIAIVISIFIFVLLVTLLVLRQLALRRRAQLVRDIDVPLTESSSRSTTSTYHSAHRGEVRIVIERRWGQERLWPAPPGHPLHYYGEPEMVAEREESGTADPNKWSVVSQDGSNSLPETAGVGRAY